jgi:putative hemolysin
MSAIGFGDISGLITFPDNALDLLDEWSGPLQVRVAQSWDEVDAALELRYRVFYEEMSAKPTPEQAAIRRDFDEFDPYCEHLIVVDHDMGGGRDAVVGTYRMLRRAGAEKVGRFYTAAEYDVSALIAHEGDILEMGRSCIDADHRTRAALQLLWRGVAIYVTRLKIDFLFGCASLPGTDPEALALPLSYLHHNHLAPEGLRPVAVPDRYVDMNLLPADQIDPRRAVRELPPMIRGYLRLGGLFGDGAVVDYEFNTTDVCVVVEMSRVTDKYLNHYLRDTELGEQRRARSAGD